MIILANREPYVHEKNESGIRELHPHFRANVYTDQQNVEVTHTNHVALTFYFENGAWFEYALNPRLERITVPFKVRPDQSFVPGTYSWNEYDIQIETNHSRRVSASAEVITGGFWSGTQRTARLPRVRR